MTSLNNNNFFRRGQSKVFYDSDAIWDPGETARTSFRSCKSDKEELHEDQEDLEHMVESEQESLPLEESAQFALPTIVKPIPLLGHRMNRSAELDDILEEEDTSEEDDMSLGVHSPMVMSSPSPPAVSSSNSPDSSFRIPRGSSTRRSQDSTESNTDSSESSSSGSSTYSKPAPKPRGHLAQSMSHKSHDSGFSDSADSNHDPNNGGKGTGGAGVGGKPEVHSEVVHETRTNSFDRKQYHVSKVYFYSVSDILSQEREKQQQLQEQEGGGAFCSRGEKDHVSILDCEQFRAGTPPHILLSPPRSPPPEEDLLQHSLAHCDSNVNEAGLEHKPIPIKSISTQTPGISNGGPVQSPQSRRQPAPSPRARSIGPSSPSSHLLVASPQNSPRVHTGTSSLGRSKRPLVGGSLPQDPASSGSMPQQQFPKTNGSLYESLSLGRPGDGSRGDNNSNNNNSSSSNNNNNNKRMAPRRKAILEPQDFLDQSFSSGSMSLPSPAGSSRSSGGGGGALMLRSASGGGRSGFDSFDDPLPGARQSFKSLDGGSRGGLYPYLPDGAGKFDR